MFCTGCGSQIPDGSKSCPFCGFDGSTPQEPARDETKKASTPKKRTPAKAENTVIPASDPVPPRPQENTENWWIWAIITAVCAVILATVFILGGKYIDYSNLGTLKLDSLSWEENTESDENLLTVSVTLSPSLFEGQDMANFDGEAYAQENGFLSAKANADGSVTVTMSKATYKKILEELAASIETVIDGLVKGANTPYIQSIDHNDDFSRFEIRVVADDYDAESDATLAILGQNAIVYQQFLETELYAEFTIVDDETDTILHRAVYPEA